MPKLNTTGERLKYIREKLLKLSRAELQKKYALSPDTLVAWENGKVKISKKGIDRCIELYSAEHLILSKQWLLTGEGLSPQFSFELNRYFKMLPVSEGCNEVVDDTILLAKEIAFFRSLSPNSVTGLLSSDDMLPMYARGDYVGGRFCYGDDIEKCLGKDCIVKTNDGATYIRRLIKQLEKPGYHLTCLNLNCDDSHFEPILFNVNIQCAAPIIWHRRPADNDS